MGTLERYIDRLHDEMFRPWSVAIRRNDQDYGIKMDITEKDDGFYVKADVPGYKKTEISAHVEEQILTIEAERKQEKKEDTEQYHLIERSYGHVQRSIRLPEGCDSEAIKSSKYEDGVLALVFGKKSNGDKRKKIEIK